MPIAPFVNTCGYLTSLEMNESLKNDLKTHNLNEQLATTSNYLYSMGKFFLELRK